MTMIDAASEPNSNPYDVLVNILTQSNLGLLSNLKIKKLQYGVYVSGNSDEISNDTTSYIVSFKQFPITKLIKRDDPENPQDVDWN